MSTAWVIPRSIARPPIDTLAGALAVDMADYWTPEPMRSRKAH